MSDKIILLHGNGWYYYRDSPDGQLHLSIDRPVDFRLLDTRIDVVIPPEFVNSLIREVDGLREEMEERIYGKVAQERLTDPEALDKEK